jgi:hypothetical protein
MASPHRALHVTSPYAKGDDVRELQKAANYLAGHRGISSVSADGEYGPDTDNQAKLIAWLIGLHKRHIRGSVSVYTQRLIRNPRWRTPLERHRATSRWKAYKGRHKSGAEAVLAACRGHIGETEHPAGSNRGPWVSKWQREFGIDGQPWCGAFVGYYLQHVAGLPIPSGVVYTPNIRSYGATRTGGFDSLHSWDGRQPGDLILFKWPGISSDFCDHVGILDADRVHTIEGNTSSGTSGSQNNGGGVYRRDRGSADVVAVVRPRY